MSYDDVTPAYVDILTYNKYVSMTSNTTEFGLIKDQMTVYLNRDVDYMPSAKYTRALALLIAHYYAMHPDSDPEDRSIGPITGQKVGELSTQRGLQPYLGTIKGSNTWLAQSRYGIEFLHLMKSFKSHPTVT